MELIARLWNGTVNWLWMMEDHDIFWWTLVLTTAGVLAGIFVLALTYRAVRETRIQSQTSARATSAQFGVLLRQAFTSHNETYVNLRPGGIWHGSSGLPNAIADFAKIESYMGLLEYCDELLEEGFLDLGAFVRGYQYRVSNLLTNRWVTSEKLIERRRGWLGFINLCYRLGAPDIPSDVPPLSEEERAILYSKRRRARSAMAF